MKGMYVTNIKTMHRSIKYETLKFVFREIMPTKLIKKFKKKKKKDICRHIHKWQEISP